jgi:predicted transcriptional regulator
MARPSQGTPTERELLLLKLLWQVGEATVRDIHGLFPKRPKPAYNSLQTNLQAMLDKGYVSRDASSKTHVYKAAISQDEVEQQVVDNVLKNVFNGSALKLLSAALSSELVSADELDKLETLIKTQENRD